MNEPFFDKISNEEIAEYIIKTYHDRICPSKIFELPPDNYDLTTVDGCVKYVVNCEECFMEEYDSESIIRKVGKYDEDVYVDYYWQHIPYSILSTEEFWISYLKNISHDNLEMQGNEDLCLGHIDNFKTELFKNYIKEIYEKKNNDGWSEGFLEITNIDDLIWLYDNLGEHGLRAIPNENLLGLLKNYYCVEWDVGYHNQLLLSNLDKIKEKHYFADKLNRELPTKDCKLEKKTKI